MAQLNTVIRNHANAPSSLHEGALLVALVLLFSAVSLWRLNQGVERFLRGAASPAPSSPSLEGSERAACIDLTPHPAAES
jgi:hypothetical protein